MQASPKKARRDPHRTQWAAQFAVASELCKRGHEVAFTMGNHPNIDLMASSPSQAAFCVDVKGLYKKNFWGAKAKKPKKNLFYVFAFVPDDSTNRFFVMTQPQVNNEITASNAAAKKRALQKGRSTEKAELFPGVRWKVAEKYENAWHVLPR